MNDRGKVNLIIASKQPRPQFYSMAEAEMLANNGLGIIDWASTTNGEEPDVVIAAAGTEPNMESLAAINILHDRFPELKIRFINVIDLLKKGTLLLHLICECLTNLTASTWLKT